VTGYYTVHGVKMKEAMRKEMEGAMRKRKEQEDTPVKEVIRDIGVVETRGRR